MDWEGRKDIVHNPGRYLPGLPPTTPNYCHFPCQSTRSQVTSTCKSKEADTMAEQCVLQHTPKDNRLCRQQLSHSLSISPSHLLPSFARLVAICRREEDHNYERLGGRSGGQGPSPRSMSGRPTAGCAPHTAAFFHRVQQTEDMRTDWHNPA